MTFLSVLRLVAVWFPEARKPLLTQFTAIAGQLGAMLAAIPVVDALHRFYDLLREHINKEENGLFPAAAIALDGAAWDRAQALLDAP